MKPLYTNKQYKNAKSTDGLSCECYQCGNIFYKQKRYVTSILKGDKHRRKAMFCSKDCQFKHRITQQELKCTSCNKIFMRHKSEMGKSKNYFCSKSCSGTYNNTHKVHGYRRSKLEIYLEEQLKSLYPILKAKYNETEAINSELDIYIPSLNVAFELNGIFHYKPIYGEKKLSQTQNNDDKKLQACLDKNIELVIIDAASLKYFKPDNAKKYLDIITNVINKKNSCSARY